MLSSLPVHSKVTSLQLIVLLGLAVIIVSGDLVSGGGGSGGTIWLGDGRGDSALQPVYIESNKIRHRADNFTIVVDLCIG